MRSVSCGMSWFFGFLFVSLNLTSNWLSAFDFTVDDDKESVNPPLNVYSALIVFGDSYSDNGHPRLEKYQKSLALPPSLGGRYSDGPVWDEYLAQNLSLDSNITFLNYAYNGAHIKNKLSNISPTPVPDTAMQIQTYLNELQQYVDQSASPNVFDNRILHTLWIGINPIIVKWSLWMRDNKAIDPPPFWGSQLVGILDQQVGELANQLTQLLHNPNLSKFKTDYILMTIPPLTNTKLIRDTAFKAAKGDGPLAQKYIKLISDMTDYFNSKLFAKVRRIKATLKDSGPQSRVAVFDTKALWDEVTSNPRMFGFDSISYCHDEDKNTPCDQPNRFMYWDILHPSSSFHAHISDAIMSFLGTFDE